MLALVIIAGVLLALSMGVLSMLFFKNKELTATAHFWMCAYQSQRKHGFIEWKEMPDSDLKWLLEKAGQCELKN